VRSYIPDLADQMLRQLSDRLRELGQTPLLLWVICDVMRQSPTEELPNNLGGVFRVFTKAYELSSIRKHEVAALKGDVMPLSDRRLWVKALKRLAFSMMQGKTPIDFRVVISRNEAEKILESLFEREVSPSATARNCLDDLLKYHLLQCSSASDKLEFRHQMIQEYYAAEALLERLPRVSDVELQRDYLNYLKWTEPVALMLALVDDSDDALGVVRSGLEVDLVVGARLVGEVKREFQEEAIRYIRNMITSEFLKTRLLSRTKSIEAIPDLVINIECESYPVRCVAAEALGQIGGQQSVEALKRAARDTAYFVHNVAGAALGAIGDSAAIAALLEILEDPEDNVSQLRAAYELAKLGHSKGIQKLRRDLSHPEIPIVRRAISALKQLTTEASNRTLMEALRYSRNKVRVLIIEASEKITNDTWIPDLLKVLEHEDSRSHEFIALDNSVVNSLGQLGSDKAIAALMNLAEHPRPLVRRKVLETLGNTGSKQAIPALQKALKDQDVCIREIAVTALGRIDDKLSKIELFQALEDEIDAHVRVAIAITLGELRSKEAAPKLIQMLRDEDQQFRWDISDALGKIGEKDTVVKLLELLKNPSTQVRQIAARTIGLIGDASVVSELAKALFTEELGIANKVNSPRSSTIETSESVTEDLEEYEEVVVSLAIALMYLNCCMGILILKQKIKDLVPYSSLWSYFSFDLSTNLKTKFAIPALLELLKLQSEEIRHAAAAAIDHILRNTEELDVMLLPLVRKTLAHANRYADMYIYMVVIPLLCKINSEESVSELIKILDYPHQNIRLKAASALAELKNESAIPVLLVMLESEDVPVRHDAAFALGELGSEQVISIFIDLLRHRSSKARREIMEVLEITGNPRALTVLKELELECSDDELAMTIATIQSKCKYYNHEIYQASLEPEAIADPAPKPASNVTMNFNAPVYSAAGNVEGNQVIYPDSPTP
jgi:HEAT repeat protein